VEAGLAIDKTLEETGRTLEGRFHGNVSPITLDGEKAILLKCPKDGTLNRPEVMIISRHDGYQYLISGGAIGNRSTTTGVEAIRSTWKWIEFEPPSEHAELGSPFIALGGAVKMRIVELMHTYPARDPTKLDLGLFNLKRNRPD